VTARSAKQPAEKAGASTKRSRAPKAAQVEEATVDAVVSAIPDVVEVAQSDLTARIERIVVFSLEGQRYALPIDVVQEIQQIVALSEIPDDSGGVVGVINLRGAVVPVMDLRRLLGLPVREYDLQTPMVFVRSPRGLVALIVDQVEDVVEVPEGGIQPPSEVFALADRLLGICRLDSGPVFVFSIERLIPAREGRR